MSASDLEQVTRRDGLEKIIVAIEDVWNVWPLMREGFQARLPLKKAVLNNKTRSPVTVERLPVDYITTNDNRLRNRPAHDSTPYWFRHPYAAVFIVVCEDLEEYKQHVKPRLRSMLTTDWREWVILYVTRAPANDPAAKLRKRVYARLEDDFSSKKRDRCCKLDLHSLDDVASWEDIEGKIVECIRNTLDVRVQFYEEEVRKLSENRFMPGWNFSSFFVVKESLAYMYEMAQLREEALCEYDELEQIFLEVANSANWKKTDFGGVDAADERAALLEQDRKPLTVFVTGQYVREFDFRQYLFARQAMLLFALNRPSEVAERSLSFILSFSKALQENERILPFCLKEVWVYTACMAVARATTERFSRNLTLQAEKDFYRLQGDLYAYARAKLMRLGDLIGYGGSIDKGPCNSAALSFSPWPRPAVWPELSDDSQDLVNAKMELLKAAESARSPRDLPIAPAKLSSEANRRRASLSDFPRSLTLSPSRRMSRTFRSPEGGSPQTSGPTSPASSPPDSSTLYGQARKIMSLAEVQVAADLRLQSTVTDETLHLALSSVTAFEESYLEVTRLAADNYHRAQWRRHGISLDAQVAAVHVRRGNLDSAVTGLGKLATLLAAEDWQPLLPAVLLQLSSCQKALNDGPGYLDSCVRLLSLRPGLIPPPEREQLQTDLCAAATSADLLRNSTAVEAPEMLVLSPVSGPRLELAEGDPGTLRVRVWSGFPLPLELESLAVYLQPQGATGGGASEEATKEGKLVKTAEAPRLQPGINELELQLTPQRQGVYTLGPLLAILGKAKMRSPTLSVSGGPPSSDNHLSLERSPRPVLTVAPARPLVEIGLAAAWGLLLGETQWVGLLIHPFNYSLQGASLLITLGPGLTMDDPQVAELELLPPPPPLPIPALSPALKPSADSAGADGTAPANGNAPAKAKKHLVPVEVRNGAVFLPDEAALCESTLWVRMHATREEDLLCSATASFNATQLSPPPSPGGVSSPGLALSPRQTRSSSLAPGGGSLSQMSGGSLGLGLLDSARSVYVRLSYGAGGGRMYERAIPLHFTDAFRAVTRVVSKGNDGTLLLQVTLKSQITCKMRIADARMELQSGFVHAHGRSDGRCESAGLLPLIITDGGEGALLFTIHPAPTPPSIETPSAGSATSSSPNPYTNRTSLRITYVVEGDRSGGAHAPVAAAGSAAGSGGAAAGLGPAEAVFTHLFVLQKPVIERTLAVGLLPPSADAPVRVGEPLLLQWRVERLVEGRALPSAGSREGEEGGAQAVTDEEEEELLYDVKVSPEQWMIAGRRKGRIVLKCRVGARCSVTLACVPIVSGHLHPPSLRLPQINRGHISHSPAGPHLICVLPPAISSAFCVASPPLSVAS